MEYVAAGPAVFFAATFFFLVCLASFHGMGAMLVGGAFPRETAEDILLYRAFSVATGAFALSVWMFAWGAAGWLSPLTAVSFLAGGMTAFWFDARRHGAEEANAIAGAWERLRLPDRLGIGAVLAAGAVTFVAALAPEAGNDSMAYHLYFPKLHALAGRLVHVPEHPRSLWPAMMGMLFTAGLLLQGTALAKLFAWMTLGLAAAAAGSFARARFGAAAARWTSVLLLSSPILWQQSFYAYVDNALVLYTFLAFVALWRWEDRGHAARPGFVAGLCLAALLSIKFTAIVSVLFFAAIFGWRLARAPRAAREKISAAAVVVATAFAFCAFWYVRSWIFTGNPVFPFLSKVFDNGFSQRMVGFAEIPRTPFSALMIPWDLTMKVATFGGEPVGAVFLAALPLLLFFPRRDAVAASAAVFLAAYAAGWYGAIQHARFFMPALPFLALVLGASAAGWSKERASSGRALAFALAAASAIQLLSAFYFAARPAAAALGPMPAKEYLRRHERTFKFMEEASAALGPAEPVLVQGEPRLFYAPEGALLMTPVIERECAGRGIPLSRWLDEKRIYHVITAGPDGVLEPPVPSRLVFKSTTSAGGRTIHYALWRRSA